jgi:hypothetical protein
MILATLLTLASALADPCPPKPDSSLFTPLPAPFPGAPEWCWEGYLGAIAKCSADRAACLASIPPTSPILCSLRDQCDALYVACMTGAEEGYVDCILIDPVDP